MIDVNYPQAISNRCPRKTPPVSWIKFGNIDTDPSKPENRVRWNFIIQKY